MCAVGNQKVSYKRSPYGIYVEAMTHHTYKNEYGV